ncbi:MAG: serine hydrolase [Bacteroidota bacterium]
MKLLSVFVFVNLCHTLMYAQVSQEAILEIADSLFNTYGFKDPGSAVLVVKDKEVILNKGYGLANLEHEIPISPSTVFDLASVSKMFTSYAIAWLIEQHQLSPEDDIRKYIPELPVYDYTVTIEHLLHHTSGIKNFIQFLPIAGWSFDDKITYEQVLNLAYDQKELNFKPGTKYSYSNTGYLLLAEVVQRVTGLSFSEWADQNIFEPLEMTSSLFVDDYSQVIPNRAYSYYDTQNGLEYKTSPNSYAVPGPSSLYSTTSDLAKWANFVDNGSDSVKAVFDRMFQKGKLNNDELTSYGYSMYIADFRGTKWISHEGYWFSFASLFVYFPEYHLSVVVLNNYAKSGYDAVREIASLYIPQPPSKKADSSVDIDSVVVAREILDEYVGAYKVEPTHYVDVFLKEGELWWQATNDLPIVMTPKSDSVFILKDNRGEIVTFQKNDVGQVASMFYRAKSCPKMQINHFDQNEIKEYLGNYMGESMKTIYTISYENNQLVLKHIRKGRLTLENIWNDDFKILGGNRWFPRALEFIRDKSGEIRAFKLTDQRFVKVTVK